MVRIGFWDLFYSTCKKEPPEPYSNQKKAPISQRAQYPLIKQYTLNDKGLHIVI